MKNLVCIILIMLCSCKTQPCPNPNYDLISKFEQNLSIVEKAQKGKSVKVDDYRKALLYLSNTTHIMTQSDVGSSIGYNSRSEYDHDLKLWKEWLNNNRCLPTK
jgi:hypothetical protein